MTIFPYWIHVGLWAQAMLHRVSSEVLAFERCTNNKTGGSSPLQPKWQDVHDLQKIQILTHNTFCHFSQSHMSCVIWGPSYLGFRSYALHADPLNLLMVLSLIWNTFLLFLLCILYLLKVLLYCTVLFTCCTPCMYPTCIIRHNVNSEDKEGFVKGHFRNTLPLLFLKVEMQHGCVCQLSRLAEQHSSALCWQWMASIQCAEPQNRPAAQNRSVYLQTLFCPLLETVSLSMTRLQAHSIPHSSSRMQMGSWLCRSFRRAQRQTPLLFKHCHFMMDLCRNARWVEY